LEKLNFTDLTCRQAVREIARIIHSVHDKAKDKDFELELSWVCDESNKQHQRVPKDVFDDAVKFAVEATKEQDEEEDVMEDVAEHTE
jgi:20S proteasome subunit alpha 7